MAGPTIKAGDLAVGVWIVGQGAGLLLLLLLLLPPLLLPQLLLAAAAGTRCMHVPFKMLPEMHSLHGATLDEALLLHAPHAGVRPAAAGSQAKHPGGQQHRRDLVSGGSKV